jgi:hypothetical protein
VIGKCDQIFAVGTGTVIVIKTGAKAYKLLLRSFKERPETLLGQTIGIIKTDDIERPFIVRKIDDTADNTPVTTIADMAATITATTTAEEEVT